MKYTDFEQIMSHSRMSRYLQACHGNTKVAMTLYRKNLQLSQELFTIISCYEIALRNGIDRHYTSIHGPEWLKNSILPGGMFDNRNCIRTQKIISKSTTKLGTTYTHDKLLASLDFGFWRYLFAQPQFYAGNQSLLHVFPGKPRSTPAIQYNQTYVFNQLGLINELRNRIAHHEPVCFRPGHAIKDTTYARQHYNLILQLFQWMNIHESSLLYGLDHIYTVCDQIDKL